MVKQRIFKLTCVIPHSMLTTVLDVLGDTAKDVRMEEINGASVATPREKRTRSDAGSGKRQTRLAEAMATLVKGSTIDGEKFADMVEEAGYARTSASPCASELVRKGQLMRLPGRHASYKVL